MEKMTSRIQKLEFLLKQMDKIHLRDAAEMLNVSEMTIRRDLVSCASSVILLGGYIVKDPKTHAQKGYRIFEQQEKNTAEKMYLGKLAASLIEDGDVVFFDCGSTVPFIATQINDDIKFTALCCSINAFLALQEKPNCDLILCGGRYSRHNAFLNRIQRHSELDMICTNKAFISAAGVALQQGVTCFNFDEAKAKQRVMEKTQQAFLVVDHSKFNRVEQAYIADLSAFDTVICDKPAPTAFIDKLPTLIFK
ncbi:TPA: DNA-binding transcriptional repressor DeoR [Pasteurella multocida]|uniref:DNA-binding transcriptional repressor DeoR n=1 Tax=Pasteurella multocida TaxID=747 RepID=A0A849CRC1_PASMD|nr:DNA-binding transcriptional repressor DeoR [Pasteurella multocida]AFI47208.1 DeoR [Pasteurella multocida subsp. multocida str. 3480]AKD40684.1 protein DeoR [Pasteurella multocida OH1905]AWW53080.1 DNA-binding transcriptional repressor DeoR [Pasteurella multocida]EPE71364.1 protein DeoR [Pasteurella multocida 671/90]MCH1905659.1 DNA-binding transcriptional repressor DeoR [Pasteurella multocida]